MLAYLSYETLEGGLPHKKLGGLLVAADLTQSHRPGAIAVRFLQTKCWGGGLSSGLGGQLHAWGLASSRSAGGILGSRHCSLLRSMDCVAICGNNIRVFLGVREVQDDGDGVLRV